MNILFIEFVAMFLVSLAVVGGLIFAVVKQKIAARDVYASAVATVIFTIVLSTYFLGNSLNYELNHKFKVSNELVSHTNFKDSVINDTMLYQMIRDLRIPHANITFVQAKHESDKYRSSLYKSNFNLYGMKYATQRPTVTVNENHGYQKYDNWKESIIDLLIWQYANNVDKLSDIEYLNYLDVVYAEDPMYMIKLRNLLKTTNFEKLIKK